MSTPSVIILITVIVALAVAAWMYIRKERSRKLRRQYGPEYDNVVAHHGDRQRAEADLEARQKRIDLLNIRPLTRDECERFSTAWRLEQERFVDDPHIAVARADELVAGTMRARGYPTGEFEQRVADISVDHPQVVEHYRAAHDIAQRDQQGQATTEDLRTAMQHYRLLFEDLLDQPATRFVEVKR